jgi:Flp pilus assembly protein TadB
MVVVDMSSVTGVFVLAFMFWEMRHPPPVVFWQVSAFSAVIAVVVVISLLMSGEVVGASVWTIVAALEAWWAWKNRPPRRRKPSKVAAVVRAVAGRLAVVPA